MFYRSFMAEMSIYVKQLGRSTLLFIIYYYLCLLLKYINLYEKYY